MNISKKKMGKNNRDKSSKNEEKNNNYRIASFHHECFN